MKYAPVIIPTLNRFEHLQRCIDSLEKNVLFAPKTEVYVSVDFPPNARYESGHDKVVKLMQQYVENNSFAQLHVYYQEHNLGALSNYNFLLNEVKKAGFDRYIASEDDNEFAPNFLVYINKGLELFENDERIISINGFKDTEWFNPLGNEIIASKLFPAYGYGTWISKNDSIKREIQTMLLEKRTMSPQIIKKLFQKNKYLFSLYVNGVITQEKGIFWTQEGNFRCIDTAYGIYMHLTNRICIVPEVSKVRNWGNDGTGVNMPNRENDPFKDVALDVALDFEYKTKSVKYEKENYAVGEKFLITTYKKSLIFLACMEYLLYLLLGKNRNLLLLIRRKMRG